MSSPNFVPNAPCGVERSISSCLFAFLSAVPNAPCGVEREIQLSLINQIPMFLMHRVELKV